MFVKVWKNQNPSSVLIGMQPLWKTQFGSSLKKQLPYDPKILLLHICLREMKNIYHRRICAQIFIAALFIAKK